MDPAGSDPPLQFKSLLAYYNSKQKFLSSKRKSFAKKVSRKRQLSVSCLSLLGCKKNCCFFLTKFSHSHRASVFAGTITCVKCMQQMKCYRTFREKKIFCLLHTEIMHLKVYLSTNVYCLNCRGPRHVHL